MKKFQSHCAENPEDPLKLQNAFSKTIFLGSEGGSILPKENCFENLHSAEKAVGLLHKYLENFHQCHRTKKIVRGYP